MALRANPNFCSMRKCFTLNDDAGVTVICEGSMPVTRHETQELIVWSFEDSLPHRDELLRVLSEFHFRDRIKDLPAVGNWEK